MRPGCFRLLVRHFFDRFFDKESLSAHAEAESNVVQTLGLLAVPGAFVGILVQPLTLRYWGMVGIRYFFISLSMVTLGAAVVFKWDMLFPDRRDYQVLMPLPLRLRTVFLAKVGALALFLGLFLADINFFGALFWPGIDGGNDILPMLGTHLAVVAAAGLFMALAAASVQGVLMNTLSARMFRRASVCLQTLLMAALIMQLFVFPLVAGNLRALVRQDSAWLYYFPPFWFVGLYEWMRPAVSAPNLARLGPLALEGLAGAAALFVLAYLPAYRRHARRLLETAQPNPAGPGRLRLAVSRAFDRLVLAQPTERAVFHFITQTITRSTRHRLFLATYAGFGAALALMSLAPSPSGPLLLPFYLSFTLVSGLRAAFNLPSELRANWAFQMTEGEDATRYLAATRKWIAVCGILPLFLLLAPVEFLYFSRGAALFHLAFGVTLSLLLSEVLFLGFRKVPFTCAYFPGKVNLVGLTAMYIFGFTAYSMTVARLETWLIAEPAAAVAFFGVVALGVWMLDAWRRRELQAASALDFEGAGDPVVRTLEIG